MIVKEVTQLGNPVLSKKAKPVGDIKSKEVRKVIVDLIDSMRHYDLVGMAAPQVGVGLRIFVSEIRSTQKRKSQKNDDLRVFINPKIVWFSKSQNIFYEGCGSVAYSKLFAPVKRPSKVAIEAFDERGEKFFLKADGLLARVVQHENDHLNGISFIEKVTDIKKMMSLGEYMKMKKKK